jgi:hypothetical protein
MLRTLVFALAIGAPSMALAEQFPEAATGTVVRGHDGAELGRVANVERDANGNVTAAEIPGLEPGDAPYASSDLVAEHRPTVRASQTRERVARSLVNEASASSRQVRTR